MSWLWVLNAYQTVGKSCTCQALLYCSLGAKHAAEVQHDSAAGHLLDGRVGDTPSTMGSRGSEITKRLGLPVCVPVSE